MELRKRIDKALDELEYAYGAHACAPSLVSMNSCRAHAQDARNAIQRIFGDIEKQRDEALKSAEVAVKERVRIATENDTLRLANKGLQQRVFNKPQGDVIEPFDADKFNAGGWTLEYFVLSTGYWLIGRFVGMHSDGNAVVEVDEAGVMTRFAPTNLRLRKKQQTVQTIQMFANVYSTDSSGHVWGSLFPTVERAIRASAGHSGSVLADNVPVTITVAK